MAVDTLGLNDTFVSQLRDAISGGAAGLSDVPMLLKCVLKDERWRERRIKTGDAVRFSRFEEFVAAKPLEGLGCDMALVKRICTGDVEALDLLDIALKQPHVRNGETGRFSSAVDNVHDGRELEVRPSGNNAQRAIRKLREDRPDLHEKVIAGEVSPHAAMIEAGFRKPSITLPVDPEAAVRLIVKHFKGDALYELIRGLVNWSGADIDTNPEQESR